eukprot:15455680-Alexandrium_andersonii.AAC.1
MRPPSLRQRASPPASRELGALCLAAPCQWASRGRCQVGVDRLGGWATATSVKHGMQEIRLAKEIPWKSDERCRRWA